MLISVYADIRLVLLLKILFVISYIIINELHTCLWLHSFSNNF